MKNLATVFAVLFVLATPLQAQIGIEYFDDFCIGKGFASYYQPCDSVVYKQVNEYGEYQGDLYFSKDGKNLFMERENISSKDIRIEKPKTGWYFFYVTQTLFFAIDTRDKETRMNDPLASIDKNCYIVYKNYVCGTPNGIN